MGDPSNQFKKGEDQFEKWTPSEKDPGPGQDSANHFFKKTTEKGGDAGNQFVKGEDQFAKFSPNQGEVDSGPTQDSANHFFKKTTEKGGGPSEDTEM